MEKKKVKIMLSAAAVMTAAGSGIFCAWKAGKKKKMAEVRADAPDLEEGLTEEKVRESLLRLFRLYADSEFDDLAEFLGDGSNPREYAAENYSGQLFLYLAAYHAGWIMEKLIRHGKRLFPCTVIPFQYHYICQIILPCALRTRYGCLRTGSLRLFIVSV